MTKNNLIKIKTKNHYPTVVVSANRMLRSESLAIMYKYNNRGLIRFRLVEIISKTQGMYKPLTGFTIFQDLPFAFDDTQLYGDYYLSEIMRKDDLCYFLTHKEHAKTRNYTLAKMVAQNHEGDVYTIDFCFEKDKNHHQFLYFDEFGLFKDGQAPLKDWLRFEQDLNEMFYQKRNHGKNFLSRHENMMQELNIKKAEKKTFVEILMGR